jgi:hypothetical protein
MTYDNLYVEGSASWGRDSYIQNRNIAYNLLGAQFGQGCTAFISYEAAMGLNDYQEHSVNAGVRLDF